MRACGRATQAARCDRGVDLCGGAHTRSPPRPHARVRARGGKLPMPRLHSRARRARAFPPRLPARLTHAPLCTGRAPRGLGPGALHPCARVAHEPLSSLRPAAGADQCAARRARPRSQAPARLHQRVRGHDAPPKRHAHALVRCTCAQAQGARGHGSGHRPAGRSRLCSRRLWGAALLYRALAALLRGVGALGRTRGFCSAVHIFCNAHAFTGGRVWRWGQRRAGSGAGCGRSRRVPHRLAGL
mmetsp:Transcript_16306/g.49879  ORF Transcript_16306/g.49879 Transcript_16306/m.49879 type:complete len:243 (+) Transcript_16306:160-888(+)